MVGRQIPTTSTLVAFEAAARLGSFSLAARELVVTEGAISRQIARLEGVLRVSLFVRRGNRVELTEQGSRYAEEVGRILASLERSTLQVMTTPPERRVLELAAVSTFATRWLIPRLPAFSRQHPDVAVNISGRNDPFLLSGSGFDAAITFAHPALAGIESRYLFRSSLIAVCSPSLARSDGAVGVGALSGLPLLHKTTTPESWGDYSRESGIALHDATAGSRFEQFSMLIEAALVGLGVALVPYLYVAEDLRAGSLAAVGPPGQHVGKDFIFVVDSQSSRVELIDEFADWLVEEAKSDAVSAGVEAGLQTSATIE